MSKPKEFAQGSKGEKMVIDLLSKVGGKSVIPEKPLKSHDLEIELGNKKFTGEVKYDLMGHRTGNIALEFWNSKQNAPSGITATKADLWFHIFKEEIWVANTISLKVYIQNNQPNKIIFSGGDNNANLYIYKADTILTSAFILLHNKEDKDLLSSILQLV